MSFSPVDGSLGLACECCGKTGVQIYLWKPGTQSDDKYKQYYCVTCSKRPNSETCQCYSFK